MLMTRAVVVIMHVHVVLTILAVSPQPVVGEACQKYDRIYSTPLGMYFSARDNKGQFFDMMVRGTIQSSALVQSCGTYPLSSI